MAVAMAKRAGDCDDDARWRCAMLIHADADADAAFAGTEHVVFEGKGEGAEEPSSRDFVAAACLADAAGAVARETRCEDEADAVALKVFMWRKLSGLSIIWAVSISSSALCRNFASADSAATANSTCVQGTVDEGDAAAGTAHSDWQDNNCGVTSEAPSIAK